MYMLNVGIETAYRLLAAAGLVKLLPKGECLVFALAAAILSYVRQRHPEQLSALMSKPLAAIEDNSSCEEPVTFFSRDLDAKLKIPRQFAASPVGYILSGTVRASLLAAFIKLLGSVVNLIRSFVPNKSTALPANMESSTFFTRHSLSFFIVFGTTLYRIGRLLMNTTLTESHKYAPLLPGLLAGLASFFYPSVVLSQFLLVQAIESVWKILVAKQQVIPPRKGGSIIFGLTSALLLYGAVFEKKAVRPSTLRLLGALSDGNLTQLPKLRG